MKSSVWICVCVKTHTHTQYTDTHSHPEVDAHGGDEAPGQKGSIFEADQQTGLSYTWVSHQHHLRHTHTQREASSNWINVLHSPLVFTLVGTFEESIRIKWQTNCGSVNVMDSRSSEGHETGSLKNTLERSRNLNESGEVKKVKHFFVVFLGQGPQTSSSGATSRLK